MRLKSFVVFTDQVTSTTSGKGGWDSDEIEIIGCCWAVLFGSVEKEDGTQMRLKRRYGRENDKKRNVEKEDGTQMRLKHVEMSNAKKESNSCGKGRWYSDEIETPYIIDHFTTQPPAWKRRMVLR